MVVSLRSFREKYSCGIPARSLRLACKQSNDPTIISIAMAYIVMAYIGMVHIGMAYIGMADMVMAYRIMAYM